MKNYQLIILLISLTAFSNCQLVKEKQGSMLGGTSNSSIQYCYINNCRSCPITPFECDYCYNPYNCCSKFCLNCTNSTCNQCMPGFNRKIGLCVPQDACLQQVTSCAKCNEDGVCQSCQSGYYLQFVVNQCWKCPKGCLTCSSSDNCTTCYNSYYLSQNNCYKCGYNCQQCVDGNNCRNCMNNYYNVDGLCVSCPQFCSSCNITQGLLKCFSCNVGFYLNQNSNCSACPRGCAHCNNSNSCQNCILNSTYYNNATNQCQFCSFGCQLCLNTTYCSSCGSHFYMIGDGKCGSCLTANCLSCSSPTVCDVCAPGYSSVQGHCIGCGQGCNQCNIDSQQKTIQCKNCLDGYFYQNGTCEQCPQNCNQCLNETVCTLCAQGFTGIQCTPALPHCFYLPNSTYCDTCTQGYYKTFNNIIQCLPCETINCKICLPNNMTNSICVTCMVGFFLNNTLCQKCQSPCLNCIKNASYCQSCLSSRYYLKNGTCMPCSSNCISCVYSFVLGGVNCQQCAGGFYKTSQGALQTCTQCKNDDCTICHPTQQTNITAQTQTTCIACPLFSSLSNGTCILCPMYCISCQNGEDNDVICNSCQIGFGLDNNQCVNCPVGCSSCDNQQTCLQCNDQYILMTQSATCMPCSHSFGSSCLQCTRYTCTECLAGFFTSGQSCSPCSNNCVQCYSDTSCDQCQDGYYLSNNRTCVACSGSCNSCLSPSVCRSCIANTIFNPQTSACFSCISNCQVCINPTSCISCLSGYQLNSDFGCVVAPDESSGFPWWGIVLLILLAVVIIAGIVFVVRRYCMSQSRGDSARYLELQAQSRQA